MALGGAVLFVLAVLIGVVSFNRSKVWSLVLRCFEVWSFWGDWDDLEKIEMFKLVWEFKKMGFVGMYVKMTKQLIDSVN